MRHCSPLKLALLAGAAGLMLAAVPANAQDYGPYGPPPAYQAQAPEQLEVYAPRFHEEQPTLAGPLEKVSLSSAVPYSDLDLRTGSGARELRLRVREAARTVCAQLAEAYPFQKMPGTSCFKTAYEDGIVRANEAISATRIDYRTGEY